MAGRRSKRARQPSAQAQEAALSKAAELASQSPGSSEPSQDYFPARSPSVEPCGISYFDNFSSEDEEDAAPAETTPVRYLYTSGHAFESLVVKSSTHRNLSTAGLQSVQGPATLWPHPPHILVQRLKYSCASEDSVQASFHSFLFLECCLSFWPVAFRKGPGALKKSIEQHSIWDSPLLSDSSLRGPFFDQEKQEAAIAYMKAKKAYSYLDNLKSFWGGSHFSNWCSRQQIKPAATLKNIEACFAWETSDSGPFIQHKKGLDHSAAIRSKQNVTKSRDGWVTALSVLSFLQGHDVTNQQIRNTTGYMKGSAKLETLQADAIFR